MIGTKECQLRLKDFWDIEVKLLVNWSAFGKRNAISAIISSQLEHIIAPYATDVFSWWIIIVVIFSPFIYIAWVNNCLGLENHRYFLLFILYLFIGTIYMEITIMSIWNHHIYRQNTSIMTFLCILDAALTIVLVGFNGWNWFLAMTGMSTIEFWGSTTRVKLKYLLYRAVCKNMITALKV